MTRPVALVTGFGPFLDVIDNASARVARALHDELVGELRVVAAVLPVSFDAAPRALAALLAAHAPAVALALGVSRDPEVRLERGADNLVRSSRPDASGEVWTAREVSPGGPSRLSSTLPLDGWATELHTEDLPVVASDDAGGYVCNAGYYALLMHTSQTIPCLFAHIPCECDAGRIAAVGALCRTLIARLGATGARP